MCHPGFADENLKSIFPAAYNLDGEVYALTNQEVVSRFTAKTHF